MPPVNESGNAPSPALRPPPGNPRFPLFDSLRAIAALAVVTCHVIGYGGAQGTWWGRVGFQLFSGVAIFFVISGFLLYRPFVAARASGRSPPRVADFARRRLLRIVPGYWFALTILALWPGVPYVVGPLTHQWWVFFGFGQNYRVSTAAAGIGPAWSLCVEMSFYVLLPLYALGAGRLSRRFGLLRGELVPLALIAFLGLTVRFLANVNRGPFIEVSLPATVHLFAIGMAFAVISVAMQGREPRSAFVRFVSRRPSVCWAAAIGCIVLAGTRFPLASFGTSPWRTAAHALANHLLEASAALLIVYPAVFGQHQGGLPRRILASRTLTWLGVVSYGIYLWHYPLLAWLTGHGDVPFARAPLQRLFPVGFTPLTLCLALGAVALAMTLVAATVSYYFVELPFLRRKETKLLGGFPIAITRFAAGLGLVARPGPTAGSPAESEEATPAVATGPLSS